MFWISRPGPEVLCWLWSVSGSVALCAFCLGLIALVLPWLVVSLLVVMALRGCPTTQEHRPEQLDTLSKVQARVHFSVLGQKFQLRCRVCSQTVLSSAAHAQYVVANLRILVRTAQA